MAFTTDPIVPGGLPEVHGEHRRTFEEYERPNFHNSAITRRRIEMID